MRLYRLAFLTPLALLAACGAHTPVGGANGPALGANAAAGNAGTQTAMAVPGTVTEPGRLKGLNPLQVRSVLGKPGFTRRDNPAEIWQYRGRACTLDLFIYDEGTGQQQVAHYSMRGSQPVNERECFNELVARNQGTPTG